MNTIHRAIASKIEQTRSRKRLEIMQIRWKSVTSDKRDKVAIHVSHAVLCASMEKLNSISSMLMHFGLAIADLPISSSLIWSMREDIGVVSGRIKVDQHPKCVTKHPSASIINKQQINRCDCVETFEHLYTSRLCLLPYAGNRNPFTNLHVHKLSRTKLNKNLCLSCELWTISKFIAVNTNWKRENSIIIYVVALLE